MRIEASVNKRYCLFVELSVGLGGGGKMIADDAVDVVS